MMQFINALSLAPQVNNWLANTRQPRILHVFDRACNLLNERREVLSIVTPQIGNGPFNLVLEEDILFSEYLTIESSISIPGDQPTLGDLHINTADAKLWFPRPDWVSLHAQKAAALRQITSLAVPAYPSVLSPALLSTLCASIFTADTLGSLTITSKVAGLGIGLTPAGDDFVIGAIYAAWIIHPSEIAETLVKEVAETAAPLTTSLSAAWLRSAGQGEVGILWHQFFEALISSNPVQVQNAMHRILATGETSGADAWAGFFHTSICWAEMELRRRS
jgi:hypothetical protein